VSFSRGPFMHRTSVAGKVPTRARWVWAVLAVVSLLALGGFLAANQFNRRTKLDLHRVQADIAAAKEQWDAAAAELEQMLAIDPTSEAGWLMLADVRSRQGNLAEAMRCLKLVPARSARRADALLLEGTVLLKMGRASRAEAALKECLAINRGSIEARRRLVFLYGLELRRAELHQVLWELFELNAAQGLDFVLLSGSSFIVWNAAEILPTVEAFVAADPNDARARTAVGRYRLRRNEPEQAAILLGEACRLAPSDVEPHVALAECLLETGGLAELASFLQGLERSWPDEPRLSYLRGRIAEESDRVEEAIAQYTRAVQRDPDHKESLYRMGQLLTSSGRRAEAEPHLARAKTLAERELLLSTVVSTGEPRVYAAQIARLEVELGHGALARAWYTETVRLNPDDAELRSEARAFLTGGMRPAAR